MLEERENYCMRDIARAKRSAAPGSCEEIKSGARPDHLGWKIHVQSSTASALPQPGPTFRWFKRLGRSDRLPRRPHSRRGPDGPRAHNGRFPSHHLRGAQRPVCDLEAPPLPGPFFQYRRDSRRARGTSSLTSPRGRRGTPCNWPVPAVNIDLAISPGANHVSPGEVAVGPGATFS